MIRMPELVMVSQVEKIEQLKTLLEDLFKRGNYAEMTHAIGMHSILMVSEHMIGDQSSLYHLVLDLIKTKITNAKGKTYGAWYSDFPRLLDELLSSNKIGLDRAALDAVMSHRAAFGKFSSLDHFFFWAIDDRRLPLGQIVSCIEKTTA
jgi:hypothetical protein